MLVYLKKIVFPLVISFSVLSFLIYGKYAVFFGHLIFYSLFVRLFFTISAIVFIFIIRKRNIKNLFFNLIRYKTIATTFETIHQQVSQLKLDINHFIKSKKINKKTIFIRFDDNEKINVSISESNMLRLSLPGSINKIKLFYFVFIINFILRSFRLNIIYLNSEYRINKINEISFIRFNPFVKVIHLPIPMEDEKFFSPVTHSKVALENCWAHQIDYASISAEYEKYIFFNEVSNHRMRVLFKNNNAYSIIKSHQTLARIITLWIIFLITILFLYYGSILNEAISINRSLNLSNGKILHFSLENLNAKMINNLNQLNHLINQKSISNCVFVFPHSILKNKIQLGMNQFNDTYLSNELTRCSQKLKEESTSDFISYLSIRLQTKQNQIPLMALLNYYDENDYFYKLNLTSNLSKDLTGLIHPAVIRKDMSYEALLYNEMLIDAYSRRETAVSLTSKTLHLPTRKGSYYYSFNGYNHLITTQLPSFCRGINTIFPKTKVIEFKKIDQEKFFSLYDQSYMKFWDETLSSIQFRDLSSESDLISAYQAIGKNHEYENFLRNIYNNTFLMMDKRNQIYQHYEFLYSLFKGGRIHSDSFTQVIHSLIQCESFLSDLMHDENKQMKSYELLTSSNQDNSNPYTKFVSDIDKLPIQIRPLFRDLIRATNHYLVRQALFYLNSKWKNELFPSLKSGYSKSFPFVFDSKEGDQLKRFNAYFSGSSSLSNFINQLSDFLDKFDHELKSEAFSHFISPVALVQAHTFISLLKSGFFEKEGCAVELTPRYLSSNSQRVEMNFSDKYFNYQHGPELALHFQWSKQLDVVIISFQDFRNQVHIKEFQGEFALFQFIKSSRCKNLRPGTLFCQYSQDGFEFDYEVAFDNPMIQTPLFALPETLLKG